MCQLLSCPSLMFPLSPRRAIFQVKGIGMLAASIHRASHFQHWWDLMHAHSRWIWVSLLCPQSAHNGGISAHEDNLSRRGSFPCYIFQRRKNVTRKPKPTFSSNIGSALWVILLQGFGGWGTSWKFCSAIQSWDFSLTSRLPLELDHSLRSVQALPMLFILSWLTAWISEAIKGFSLSVSLKREARVSLYTQSYIWVSQRSL